ncbi:MAG: hypothetical protein IH880_09475 [Candidatus Marinimicrobia bacterium]|nr:hypothetical protein [Candidatus Neomarinimicrobiota bacterium]
MKIKLSLKLLFVVLLADSNVEAGSLYGKFGVGERQYISSARSIGMGGINLSIKDRYTMSRWNPALWAFVSPVRINLLSTTNYNAVDGGNSGTFTDFSGFGMVLPMGSKFSVGGGVYPISNSNYELVRDGIVNDEPWELTIKGRGGINGFGLGFGYKFNDDFSIGLKNDWVFGNKTEEWKTIFDNGLFNDTEFTRLTSFDGTLWTFGIFNSRGKFNFAASASIPFEFDIKKEIESAHSANSKDPAKNIDFPAEWRFGVSYDPGENYVAGIDYQFSDWKSLENDFDGNFGRAYDIFGGIERKSSPAAESFLKRIALRAGLGYRQLYVRSLSGSRIVETSGSAGFGIPMHGGKEFIDIGVSFVLRKSGAASDLKENSVSIVLGYSAGELWFVRRKR